MASWWRMMIFGIVVFAAVATPTGDPGTMTMLAAPMCILFAVALGLAWLNDRRRERRRRDDPDSQLSPDEAAVLDTTPSRLDDMDDIP
jgi:sec-independent protein translocase protein TatC